MDEPLKRGKDNVTEGGQEHEEKKGPGNRKKNVDDLRIETNKKYEAGIDSEIVRIKALEMPRKRIASGELSTSMLLRIATGLAKSTEKMVLAAMREPGR
jgi:hypothetical protein